MRNIFLSNMRKKRHIWVVDFLIISTSYIATTAIRHIQIRQKDGQKCSLYLVHTAIPRTSRIDMVLGTPSVLPEREYFFCDVCAICNNSTSIAKRSQIFGWIKTVTPRITKCPDILSTHFCAV